MINKKYDTVVTLQKSNSKLVEWSELYTTDTQIHNRTLSCLGKGTWIKYGGVKLVLWAKTSILSEMM